MELLQSLIGPVFALSVAVQVFAYGLTATTEDIMYVWRRPRLLIVSLLAMFVVTPVFALAIESYFDFPHATRVAIVVLALTPTAALLPRTEIASGGRASYAYGLGFVVSLLAIVIVPVLVDFVGRVMDRPFGVPPGTVASALTLQVLLPLALGFALARLIPKLVDRVKEPIVRIAGIVLNLALLLLLIAILPSILDTLNVGTVLAMVAFIASGLFIGHFMGGPDPQDSVVLAIASANRNPGLGISIAASLFPAEAFAATMVIYGIIVGLVTKPYVRWQRSRMAIAEESASPAIPPAGESASGAPDDGP